MLLMSNVRFLSKKKKNPPPQTNKKEQKKILKKIKTHTKQRLNETNQTQFFKKMF